MVVQFSNRCKFELAISLIDKDDLNNLDIGYSDMLVSFFDERAAKSVISDWSVAQIWNKPSFHGPADYLIVGKCFEFRE